MQANHNGGSVSTQDKERRAVLNQMVRSELEAGVYEVVPDDFIDSAKSTKLVNSVLRGMRRRGLPANVDPDDLRQEGLIAVWRSGEVGPARLLAKIAKNAMNKHLNAKGKERRGSVQLVTDSNGEFVPPKASRDPFLSLDLGGMEARHDEWERERAERWA